MTKLENFLKSNKDRQIWTILKGKNSTDTLLDEVMTKELITVTRDF